MCFGPVYDWYSEKKSKLFQQVVQQAIVEIKVIPTNTADPQSLVDLIVIRERKGIQIIKHAHS